MTALLNSIDGGSGAPIVLVHGFSDQSISWFLADSDLLRGFRFVAVDLPGHGRSEPWTGEKLSIHDMAEELDKVMEALGIGKFALVGHSMGGMVAQQYCLEHPHAISCLFLCSTAARGSLLSETAFNLEATKEAIRKDGIVSALSMDPHAAFAPGYESPLVHKYLELEFGTDGETAVKCLDAMKDWELDQAKARGYPGPTVIICGDMDKITPSNFSFELGRAYPDSAAEIVPGAGHMVFLEKPQEFREIVRRHMVRASKLEG